MLLNKPITVTKEGLEQALKELANNGLAKIIGYDDTSNEPIYEITEEGKQVLKDILRNKD